MGEGFKWQRSGEVPKLEPYLYKYGNEYTGLTGGWNSYFTAGVYFTHFTKLTKNVNNIYGAFSGERHYHSLNTVNLIDLSQYTRLNALCNMTTATGDAHARLSVLSNNSNYQDEYLIAEHTIRNTAGGIELNIDISALNASYYIGVAFHCGGGRYAELTGAFTKVWLE